MSEKTTPPTFKAMNFKLQLILFFVTGTLWEPFYNLLCFMGLNKLSFFPRPEGVPSTKTSAIGQFFLVCSIVGAPFAYFRRYQLLHYYIKASEPHLAPLPKVKNDEGVEVPAERLNCIEPMKFVGFAIVTFLLIGLCIGSYALVIYHLVVFGTATGSGSVWIDNKIYMIFLPIAIGTTLMSFGFIMRTIKEEKKWFKAYNAIAEEVMKK
ncbi:MAG: hypothetical protein ACTSXA_13215 [Candidatus Heimdallarchaeota archaeon]